VKPALDLIRKRDNVFAKRGLVCAPVEVVEKRTERGKTFDLGNGQFHLSTSVAPVHYRDASGDWQEIDLGFRFVETPHGTMFRMDKAAYICDVFTDRVGWRHTSREGWWRQCVLTHVDGVPVAYDGLPRVNDNVVLYDKVTPDLDVKVCAYRLKSEKFHRPAKPMTLTWRVTSSECAGGSFQEKTKGWDKDGDTLEMLSVLDGETFTETWTGRVSKVVDKRTRRKAWTTEPEYPVMVDASISEEITTNADDGFQMFSSWRSVSGTDAAWFAGLSSFPLHGGLRFQSLAIPLAATISAATVTLNITSVTGTPDTRLFGDDVDDAAAWSNSNLPSGITQTTANVAVSPSATGTGYTINIQSVAAELFARGGWASGNDARFGIINFATTGVHVFLAEDYNAAGTNEAQLDITYTVASTGAPTMFRNRRGITQSILRNS